MIRRLSAWILALALVAGCQPSLEEAQQRGHQALEAGDPARVQAALDDLRGRRLASPETLLLVTDLMLRAGEAPQAVWDLEEGLERFPDRDDLRVALARVALVVGNPSRAASVLADVGPDSASHLASLLLRARAALDLGDLDAALALFDEAERTHPDAPEAAVARIATLVQERRFEEAGAAIERVRASGVLERAGISIEALAARIEILAGDRDAARARLRRRHDEAPDDLAALDLLLPLLAADGDVDEALTRARASRDAVPDRPEAWSLLARVHVMRGERDAAEKALRTFAERADTPSAAVQLALFYQHTGAPERASEVFADAAERHPDVPLLVMHHAESLVDLGRLDEARRRAEDFERLAPDDPHTGYLAARIALAEGRSDDAVATLRRVVSRLDRSYTQYWLGRALEQGGDVEGAARRYGLALQREHHDPAPVIALLRLAERRGDWKDTAQIALRLVERTPERPEGYTTAVTALARAGRSEEALALARVFGQRFPDDPQAFASRAFALRASGDLDGAERVLAEAEARNLDPPALVAEGALLLGVRGRTDEALARLAEGERRHPDAARLPAAAAALHFGRGEAEAGARAVDRALALDPEHLEPLALRARFRAATGDDAAALADAERYLAARPRDGEVLFLRGALLARLGRTAEAIAAYRRAIEVRPQGFAARNNLALLLEASGQDDEALRVAQEAYALAESEPDVVDTLAGLYLRRGLADRAVALFERAHQLAPDDPSTALHLARAYAEEGRSGRARALLEEVVAHTKPGSDLRSDADAALRTLAD